MMRVLLIDKENLKGKTRSVFYEVEKDIPICQSNPNMGGRDARGRRALPTISATPTQRYS